MAPDQQAQCKVLARLWGETPDELWQWWLDAEEDGSTWPSFFRDMLEYAPRQASSLRRTILARGKVNYRNTLNRLKRGWTLEEALLTPPREYPASQGAARVAAGAVSRDNLRKANEARAAARSQR